MTDPVGPASTRELGILLVGHGTRDERGRREFREVVRQATARVAPVPVEEAFLELVDPPIRIGVDRLVEQGARQLIVAPLLLFAAGHARQDIPAAMAEALLHHPGVGWRQAPHLGCHPSLLQLSASRYQAAAGARDAAARCRLVLVGRGSRDPDATREMMHYAELLRHRVPVDQLAVGFLALAQPRLEAVLAESAASPCDTVVVLPHLLFSGELGVAVQRAVEDWGRSHPHQSWRAASHLGPADQVVTALVDRCREVAPEGVSL